MSRPEWVDRRKSASVNAVLILMAALIPVLGATDTADVDTNQVRPWGCRTCSVPVPQVPATPLDDSL
jgi:hypothetical protein